MTRPGIATCGGCLTRRRCVALWYLPRSGAPRRHVGLPAGWGIARGLPFCGVCLPAAKRGVGRRSGSAR